MTWGMWCVVLFVLVLAGVAEFSAWWDRRMEQARAALERERLARRRIP